MKSCGYRANQREEEARPHTGTDVSDWQDETCWYAFLVGLVREGEVRLGHADGEVTKALHRDTDMIRRR